MKYGLYDTQDHLWLGENDDGTIPKLYEDYEIAVVTARVIDAQLDWEPGRTRAKEFADGPLRLRDSVDTKRTALEALEGLESGKIL